MICEWCSQGNHRYHDTSVYQLGCQNDSCDCLEDTVFRWVGGVLYLGITISETYRCTKCENLFNVDPSKWPTSCPCCSAKFILPYRRIKAL